MLYNVLQIIWALVLMLGGIRFISKSLQELSGELVYDFIKKSSSTTFKGFLVGACSSALIQSSSLVTALVVGFVHGGVFSLRQGLCIVIGANLGTTITSQFFSLETRGLIIIFLIAGSTMYFMEVLLHRKTGGKVLLGGAAVLAGIELLAGAMTPLSQTWYFEEWHSFSRGAVWKGIITGSVAAGLLQSSSVTIGMVIVLAREGLITISEALAILLGADLGTCVTSLLVSIGTILPARRLAWGHFFFNLFSILLVAPFWKYFLILVSMTSAELPRQIANAHAIYNLTGAIVMLPLVDNYTKILENMIKGKKTGRVEGE